MSRRKTTPTFRDAHAEPPWLRGLLVGVSGLFLLVFLVVPLVAVFVQALAKGWETYLAALAEPAARSAIQLTLWVALIVVPLNTIFGISAAWLVTRYRFRGKRLLVTLVDLPFSVSPVVAGMLFVLLFGTQGLLGPWLQERGIRILFALPGIVLATLFVTVPFVARQLIPLMESQGATEEEAALTLGASGWRTFVAVTLPKIRTALLYGILLTNARAMGEFGAVSVVSGHIRGRTNTLPLHVEILYNEYQFAASFAVASLLTLLALATLVVQALARRSEGRSR